MPGQVRLTDQTGFLDALPNERQPTRQVAALLEQDARIERDVEIIEGELYVQPRPRAPHARVEAIIIGATHGPYDLGQGGPGGWWILPEPGIELPGSPEFSPDVTGWRRERLPVLPDDAPIRIVPDWICEVLSPRTRGYDLLKKRPFYARSGVQWLWYVDVEARTVSVGQLSAGAWVEVAVHGEEERVRLPPFPDVELDLRLWWTSGAA